MTLASWFTSVKQSRRRANRKATRRCNLLFVESLEGRVVPSTALTWTGADFAQNLNWSNPSNWSIAGGSDTTPQAGDTVLFNGTSSQNSVIDQSFNIGSLSESGYAGTISLGAETLTVSGSNSTVLSIADAGSFNAGSGTVAFTGGNDTVNSAASLNNLNLAMNGYLILAQPLNVNSLDVINSAALYYAGSSINVTGNVTLNAGVTGPASINLDGTTNQTITSIVAGYMTNLNVANTTGTIVLPTTLVLDHGTLTGNGTLSGAVQFGLGDGSAYGANFAGSIPEADLYLNGGTLNLQQSLNVGSLNVIDSANLSDASGHGVYPQTGNNSLNVTGNVTLDAGVGGPAWNSGNAGFINLDGAANQTITSTPLAYLTNLNIANTTGAIMLPTTLALGNQGQLTGGGTINGTVQFGLGNGQYYFNYFTGNIADVALNLNGGTLYLAQSYNSTTQTYNDQPLNAGSLNAIDPAVLADWQSNNAPLNVSGNLTIDSGVTGGAFISLDGATDQTISSSASGYLTNLNVANATGNILLPTALNLDNGTLSGDGTFSGTVQFGLGDGQGYTANFTGSISDLQLNQAGGTLNFDQPLNVASLEVISSVTLSDPAGGYRQNVTDPLNVSGNLTVDAGVGSNNYSGYFNLDGTTAQTITSSVNGSLTNLNVANTSLDSHSPLSG